jgi:hypothetical protein
LHTQVNTLRLTIRKYIIKPDLFIMQKSKVIKPFFRDILAQPLLEVVVKEDLENLLRVSCKDFAETIDFSKGYEIIHDEMPHLMVQDQQNTAYSLYAKATLKTGAICRFIANTVWLGRDNYSVDIKKMPNYAEKRRLLAPNQI